MFAYFLCLEGRKSLSTLYYAVPFFILVSFGILIELIILWDFSQTFVPKKDQTFSLKIIEFKSNICPRPVFLAPKGNKLSENNF